MGHLPFNERSLFLAPMEGVTDPTYRMVVEDLFGGWDHYCCDFLRLPSQANFKKDHYLKHYGPEVYSNKKYRKKTYYQILTPPSLYVEQAICDLGELGFEWIDLNLGCPSKKVNGRAGGSFLLSEPSMMVEVVRRIRKTHPHTFTCKIRVGFKDDSLFADIIKMLSDEGVNAITIHGRTRMQGYRGRANWDYIARAVQLTDVPIIGNGDIWTLEDIQKIYEYTGCHSVMMARGALKTPYMGHLLKNNLEDSFELRKKLIPLYIQTLAQRMSETGLDERHILGRLKSLSYHIYENFEQGPQIKQKLVRSQSLDHFLTSTL